MWQDVVHAWRALNQKPGFFAAALATLAIGIGANITIFSLVNGLSLRPMPFGDRTDRLVTLHPTHRFQVDDPDWGSAEISFRDLIDFRASPSVDGIAAYLRRNFVLSGDGSDAERVIGGSVTPDLFPLLGIEPIMGRQFTAEDAAAIGSEPTVILTHGLWQRRYGADPAIVGKSISVNDRARTVVGVLPPGIRFPINDQLYMALRGDEPSRAVRNINAVALMKPGLTVGQLDAEMRGIAARLENDYPDTNRGFGVQVVPIRRSYVGAATDRVGVMLVSAVGFVLLIMCANLANLMLVRGASRQRELAVRAAMGATGRRLLWTGLTETLLLALPGTLLGLLVSQWAIDWLLASFLPQVPYWFTFGLDWRVATFTVVVAVFTTMAVGVMPALRSRRPNLVSDLREAGRGSSLGRSGQHLQSVLAIAQVSLCFALLVGANLMVRSFLAMQTAPLGFDERPILTGGGFLAGDAYNDVRARAAFYRRMVATLEALPGVAAAAITSATPGDDGGVGRRLVLDGRTSESDELNVQSIAIGPQLFRALGLPMIAGRTFTEDEIENPRAGVAILNDALARRLWPDGSAIDRQIGFRDGPDISWYRIVGVAPDVHYEEIGAATEQSRFSVYVPYAVEGSRAMVMMVRTAGSPDSLIPAAREALRAMAPAFPLSHLTSMADVRRRTLQGEAFLGNLMAMFATAALLLACLGIYALISYSVGRRAREIGVRLALGARPHDVVRMLMRETARVGGAGLIAGLTLAVLVARALSGSVYGVRADAWLFVSMALPLAAAILAATWVPARRAARVEPTVALRDE
jgi:predicted permease